MDTETYFYQTTVNNVVIRTIQEAIKCEEATQCVSWAMVDSTISSIIMVRAASEITADLHSGGRGIAESFHSGRQKLN